MRRLARWSLPAALACLALAAAPAANAQDPTIVTDITFPEEGEPFGTFTASDPLCSSGAFVDQFVGRGGDFRGPVFYGSSTVRKHFTCADGSGSFTILPGKERSATSREEQRAGRDARVRPSPAGSHGARLRPSV